MTDQPPGDEREPDDELPADDDLAPDEPAPATDRPTRPVRPVGRTVRLGCIVLAVLGALGLALGASTASDPAQGRCAQARTVLEDESDDEDFDAGDVECETAVADALALAAADDDVSEIASESTIRTFGIIIAGIGIVQLAGAILTLRSQAKGPRLVALIGAGVGIIFSPLGLIGIPILGFVVYAILFSADARAVFGEPGGFGRRPRPAA